MFRASEAGVLGEQSNLNVRNEEDISVISRNITQLDIRLASTLDAVSTKC